KGRRGWGPPPAAAATSVAHAELFLDRLHARRLARDHGRRHALLRTLDGARQPGDAVVHLDLDAGVLERLVALDGALDALLDLAIGGLHRLPPLLGNDL